MVETEQLLVLTPASGGDPVVASFVQVRAHSGPSVCPAAPCRDGLTRAAPQVRGSIPLLWSQVPNIKYKPTTSVAPPSSYEPAFDRHARDLLDTYQARPRCC